MPRIGTCLIDGFEDYEDKLIDHVERDHAEVHRTSNVEEWREWLRQHTRVEDRLLALDAKPWIKKQYSAKIETGIGAVESTSLM